MKYVVAVIEYEIGCIDELEEKFGDALIGCETINLDDEEDVTMTLDADGNFEVL